MSQYTYVSTFSGDGTDKDLLTPTTDKRFEITAITVICSAAATCKIWMGSDTPQHRVIWGAFAANSGEKDDGQFQGSVNAKLRGNASAGTVYYKVQYNIK